LAVTVNVTATGAVGDVTFTLAGTVTTGSLLSRTVTLKAPCVEPSLLVAVQLTTVAPIGNVEPECGVQETDPPPSEETSYMTIAPAALVDSVTMSAGRNRRGGPVVTRTVNEPVASLKCASVALQWTVVVPVGNVDPEAGEQLTGSVPSMLSVAVAVKLTTGEAVTMFSGSVRTGRVVSTTTTPNRSVVVPPASVAEHCTLVTPIGNCAPDAGAQRTGTSLPFAPTAKTLYSTGAPWAFTASALTPPSGKKIVGGPSGTGAATVKVTGPWIRVTAPSTECTATECWPVCTSTSIGIQVIR
jgi:hypothetical protein